MYYTEIVKENNNKTVIRNMHACLHFHLQAKEKERLIEQKQQKVNRNNNALLFFPFPYFPALPSSFPPLLIYETGLLIFFFAFFLHEEAFFSFLVQERYEKNSCSLPMIILPILFLFAFVEGAKIT